ncbi:RICIN domain-containing protein [Streptomyces sp. NPDC056527]|uniref:RICIN domain-containing protein n=1 Tax=Streptomyces sp. NPDC056527 TaxID=3345853 RepID=UPI0036858816
MRKNTKARRLLSVATVSVLGGILLLPAPASAQPTTRSASEARISGILSFHIINGQTGKCATVAGGRSTDNNLQLVQFDCDTDPSRRWRITNWNGSSHQIVNVQTGKCATVAGGRSTDNNVELVQFDCDSDPSRRWRVTNWGGRTYQIVNVQTGKCMTVAGGRSTDNNVPLVQFTCDSDASRRWTLRLAG